MTKQLKSITDELFYLNAIDMLDGGEATDKLYEELKEKAQKAIDKYGWDTVFNSWRNYMYENCHTVEDALSFATWFDIYGGSHQKIDDPYKFLAYLYDIFDLRPVEYDAQIMDDVSYGLLEAAGIKTDLWSDDSYTTETDPELIRAVENLRRERNSEK